VGAVREAKVSLAFCNLVVALVVLMLGIVVVRWMEERRG
jgi:small-conductance mechanosensitive channel